MMRLVCLPIVIIADRAPEMLCRVGISFAAHRAPASYVDELCAFSLFVAQYDYQVVTGEFAVDDFQMGKEL